MAGMSDGYVGTAQDAVRIRRLEKQREAERRKIQELKSKSASAGGQTGLLQFGSGTSEILETAFKKETVGLVTREQYVEKRVNIRNKIEEEEKEKLQKLQQEEEELQMQKRKKRRVKGNPCLSFADDIDNGSEEEEEAQGKEYKRHGKLGKDPTVETSFLPDRGTEDDTSVRGKLRNKLNVKDCGRNGFVNRSRSEMNHLKSLTAIGMELVTGELYRSGRVTQLENFYGLFSSNLHLNSGRLGQHPLRISFT